ncbi:hypothetical protein A1O7_01620 [Cladophialophora yegresii CBS 114405]|uniref:BZIP domain-containing protein n=1 Tax=Cladophialophora yegresii CBS 114405 TaxID=1182544 RepID=W9X474_9EURO|nr:uncharacterized protein A1O7_01620 [Cladophialophora yegresii CBS 114405]EXJ65279.1 hypothetical protein A1O7_01620 [Cladophialophora yegresii CBS 114405]
MRENVTALGKGPEDAPPDMNSFVSVFHASSLYTQRAQPQQQRPDDNSHYYNPGHYWQTMDYYDVAMNICTDLTDLIHVTPSVMPSNVPPTPADDLTPLDCSIDCPFDFAPEAYGSPGDSLRLLSTDSSAQESPSAESKCPGHSRYAGQQSPCQTCLQDKKEKRREQNRKAQRNHRLRSEAKLEQLRARLKTQTDEIVMLRDFNQSLMKHIETLESKGGNDGTRDGPGSGQAPDAPLQGASASA